MKLSRLIILVPILIACGTSMAKNTVPLESANLLELKGTLQSFLLNPQGEVDGFLLADGTQVSFAPQMSAQLTQIVAPKDAVSIKGFRQNVKVFSAEVVTNTKTSNSITQVPTDQWSFNKKSPAQKLEGLAQLSVQGRIQSQLYGPHGEIAGVILSEGSIVHFAPHVLENSSIVPDIGSSLHASGPGTKNNFGESLEATELAVE